MQPPSYGSGPVSSHGARICPRCRTRIDARRGASNVCYSCGAQLPPFVAVGAKSGGSGLVWLLGGGLIFAFLIIAGLVLFVLHRGEEKGPKTLPTVTTVTVFSATPTTTATTTATATSQGPALTDAEKDQLEGTYTCSMDDTPAFTCKIANGVLEKTGGSQRFKGPIAKLPNGNLSFSGSFFCPSGDCTHPVACTFTHLGPGKYACKFGPNSVPGGGPGGEHVSLVKTR